MTQAQILYSEVLAVRNANRKAVNLVVANAGLHYGIPGDETAIGIIEATAEMPTAEQALRDAENALMADTRSDIKNMGSWRPSLSTLFSDDPIMMSEPFRRDLIAFCMSWGN